MTKANKTRAVRIAEDIKATLDVVPTEQQIKEIDSALRESIGFFSMIRERLHALPTNEEVRRTREALSVVCEFLRRAQDDQRLAVALGLQRSTQSSSTRTQQATENVKRQAVQLIRRLGGLSIEQIQHELLEEKKYSLQVLHEVARQLKIPLDAKIPKEELVDRLVKVGFANPRGYEGLRHEH